ncbi:regulator of late gene expression [Yersinia frederiksenii]|nr:regulator of late gene expression [Yersinia frederiksenii]
MNVIGLSQLPAPLVVESRDYETLLAERKAAFIALYPLNEQDAVMQTLTLESEPITKLLQESTYRELVLRQRINEAAQAVMVAYANSGDLDQLGANNNVSRLVITPANNEAIPPVAAVMESDTDFRLRIPQAFEALSVAGPTGAYEAHARSADGRVPAITHASGDKHSFRVADRDAYTGVTAYCLDLNYGKPQKTSVRRKRKTATPPKVKTPASSSKEGNYLEGVEGNVFVMRETFKTERAARRAAAARWSKLQRGAAEFSMTLARGRADLFPELPAVMQGFKPEIDQVDWIITQVTHTIGDNGFTTALNFEVKITNLDMAGEETE